MRHQAEREGNLVESACHNASPTADVLNRHYASISTDPAYVPVQRKLTAGGAGIHFTEYDVLNLLLREWMVYRRGFCVCQPLSSRPRFSLLFCLISRSYRVLCCDSGRPLLSTPYLKILRL